MTIIQLIHKVQLRGAEVFASQLSNNLVDRGHHVVMIALYAGNADLPYNGDIKVISENNNHTALRSCRILAEYVKQIQPDLVQANAGDTLKIAAISKYLYGWKAKLFFRNANKISDFLQSDIKRIFYKFILSQVEGVASVSECCRIDFMQTFSGFRKPVVFAPIGVSLEDASASSVFKEIFPTGKRLLHVGQFSSEKNHRGLLAIFTRLLSYDSQLQLLLVGEGPLKNSIQEWVCAAGLSSNVHFLGKRADVLAIMKQCDVLVLPSLIEGLPGVILEAMAVRLPVVAYDIGGISEVIHTETGWLVPKSDEKAFAGSVWEVLQGASEPREIKLNRAYQLVADHFQHKQVVGYFEKLYQDVLQSRWINCN